MNSNENVQFSNSLGSVTDKRIIVNRKEGDEEIDISKISSIIYKKNRNYFFIFLGIIVFLAGIYFFYLNLRYLGVYEIVLVILFSILGFLTALANWFGGHQIVLGFSGKDGRTISVGSSKRKEGEEFVQAIKKSIFK